MEQGGREEFMDSKYKLLEMSEISILLQSYEDIFSDFDPRGYSQKSLSEDFLSEAKRAAVDKNHGQIQLRFMVPHNLRSSVKEMTIKKRLHDHFRHHYNMIEAEKRGVVRKGFILTILGIIFLLVATYVKSMEANSFWMRLLFVTIEPTSWFIAWYGLDYIFSSRHTPDENFYKKMSKCEIKFFSY